MSEEEGSWGHSEFQLMTFLSGLMWSPPTGATLGLGAWQRRWFSPALGLDEGRGVLQEHVSECPESTMNLGLAAGGTQHGLYCLLTVKHLMLLRKHPCAFAARVHAQESQSFCMVVGVLPWFHIHQEGSFPFKLDKQLRGTVSSS